MLNKDIIAKGKFADFYKTTNGKKAVFLRFAENSEGKYALFYVDDWGEVQVFRENGKEVYGDMEHSIVGLWEEDSVPEGLDEAAIQFAQRAYSPFEDAYEVSRAFQNDVACFKAGAKWMAGQGQTFEAHVDNGCAIASGVKLPFVLWDTYEDGDMLKVQIRKKQ